MHLKVGISVKTGVLGVMTPTDPYHDLLSDDQRGRPNLAVGDGWHIKVNFKKRTFRVTRPAIGSCGSYHKVFSLRDGTLHLKSLPKYAKATFSAKLDFQLWQQFGIMEICHTTPDRLCPVQFRQKITENELIVYELVWVHTDGDVYRQGPIEAQSEPLDMETAIKLHLTKKMPALVTRNANFAVVYARSRNVDEGNYVLTLYSEEWSHRKIMAQLREKIATDPRLAENGFNLTQIIERTQATM